MSEPGAIGTEAALRSEVTRLNARCELLENERDFLRERLASLERTINTLAAFVANPERVS